MIEFKCLNCGEAMSAPTSLSRGTETCPSCGHVCRVPNVYLGPIAFKDVPILGRLWSRWTVFAVAVIVGIGIVGAVILMGLSERSCRVGTSWRFPPVTVSGWSSTLEAGGWYLEKDSTVEGNAIFPDLRFVTYKKVLGDLELSACILPSVGGELIYGLSLEVRGPLESKTPAEDGLRECKLAAANLIPQADVAIDSAMRNARRRGDKNLKRGLLRLEGHASTPDGWEVIVCVYLVGLKNRNSSKVMINLKNTEAAEANDTSDKIAITGIAHKRIDSVADFVTVAWKATVRNGGSKTMNYSVEAVFIDMKRFELAKDFKYDIVLSPGGGRTVTGTVWMKSGIYKSVANLLIKVRGYPVEVR